MLSYQHIYHAGNFADVHKHAILAQILKALRAKTAPLAVLDTHAGRGLYDLTSAEAGKNREYQHGIERFWRARDTAPPALRPYLDVVARYNDGDAVTRYPGSALMARDMLRPSDKLTAIERHPGEYESLRQSLAGRPHTKIVQADGFKELPLSVPFAERRGLVIIDPSYEIKSEYADLPRQLLRAWKAWPQGVYFIWYPIMQAQGHRLMLSEMLKAGIRDVLVSEIRLEKPPETHFRMTGAGVAIVNPPWPDAVLNDVTQAVARNLAEKTFGDVFWLDNLRIDPETGLIAP